MQLIWQSLDQYTATSVFLQLVCTIQKVRAPKNCFSFFFIQFNLFTEL